MSDYETALIAAGANVKAMKSFGSYQGEWWALVEYEGRVGWINGSYGSCSGCDAFQANFNYDYDEGHTHAEPGGYYFDAVDRPVPGCPVCDLTQAKLAEFGKRYVDPDYILDQEEAIKSASKYIEWDMDAQEMVDWIKTTWEMSRE